MPIFSSSLTRIWNRECRLSKRLPRPGASSAIGSSCRNEAIKRGNSRDSNLCCRTFVMHGAGL